MSTILKTGDFYIQIGSGKNILTKEKDTWDNHIALSELSDPNISISLISNPISSTHLDFTDVDLLEAVKSIGKVLVQKYDNLGDRFDIQLVPLKPKWSWRKAGTGKPMEVEYHVEGRKTSDYGTIDLKNAKISFTFDGKTGERIVSNPHTNSMILYHGSKERCKRFTEFKLPKAVKDLSGHSSQAVTEVVWLSDEKKGAKSYAGDYLAWLYTCEFYYDKIFIESNTEEREALEEEFNKLNPDTPHDGHKRGETHSKFCKFLLTKGYQGEYIDGVYQVFDPKDLNIIDAEKI